MGRVGGSSCEAWEEGVHCCRVEEIKIPKVLGTSTEELALDRPSFFFFLPQIASLFFHFNWLYDVKMLLLSHVSSLVLCLYHVCVYVCARTWFFYTCAVESCMVCMVGCW